MQISILGRNGIGLSGAMHQFGSHLSRSGWHVATWRDRPARIEGGHFGFTLRLDRVGWGLADEDDIVVHLGVDDDGQSGEIARVLVTRWHRDGSGRHSETIEVPERPTPESAQAVDPPARALFAMGIASGLLGIYSAPDDHVCPVPISDGQRFARQRLVSRPTCGIPEHRGQHVERHFISGNEAAVAAAVAALCNFVAAYPITPATEILEGLERHLPARGGVVRMAEDEIAAINLAIGASFAGARSMTATSGPGLSLMIESVGYCAMIEVPLVIIHCSRGGPSTGMPTRVEQSDIHHVVYGGHGEFPRIVLTPGSVEQVFADVVQAFEVAASLHCPVIVLLDQVLAVDRVSARIGGSSVARRPAQPDKSPASVRSQYVRYAYSETGASPRSIPGEPGGMYVATGSEHAEDGTPTDDPRVRRRMVTRRLAKMQAAARALGSGVTRTGNPCAQVALLAFGSPTAASAEAADMLQASGTDTQVWCLRRLAPLPISELNTLASGVEVVFVVEQNAFGQLHGMLTGRLNARLMSVLQFDGRPIRPGFIAAEVERQRSLKG